jgi:hypothetical protein
MKHVLFVVAGMFAAATSALAQPPPAGQAVTLAASLNRSYTGLKLNMTEMATKMADADYTFKPGPAPELRNFGQLFGHTANAQFGSCAVALGQPNPNQGKNLEQELKTKAEFVKALADSFALCDKAFAALTDQNKDEMVAQGQGQIARSALLARCMAPAPCTCEPRGWFRPRPSARCKAGAALERPRLQGRVVAAPRRLRDSKRL